MEPENDKSEAVLSDSTSYQFEDVKMRAASDLDAIREGLTQAQSGEGLPADEFFAEFEKKHGL